MAVREERLVRLIPVSCVHKPFSFRGKSGFPVQAVFIATGLIFVSGPENIWGIVGTTEY